MRLNSKENSFVFGRKNRKIAPRTFTVNLAGRVMIICQELFYKPHKVKTSEMRLNFAGNSFIFGRIYRENTPITFSVNVAGRELSKCA